MTHEDLAKRLLSLGQYGCHLCGRDGHIWIEPAYIPGEEEMIMEHSSLHYILKKAGVSLNNKIYGGVIEALDTIDEALRLSGWSSLLDGFPGWGDTDSLFLGKGGIDRGRIFIGKKDTGGLE
jgi:hypothetical protein